MPIVLDYVAEVRAINVADILYRAGLLLQDEEHIRWTETELIEWINEAAGALVRLYPPANTRPVIVSLMAGTQQKLTSSVLQLIDVVRNVAMDDTTIGRAIRLTERHLLDSADPDWHAMAPVGTVRHYIYDDRAPSVFYVYPPAIGGTKIEMTLALLPDAVEGPDDQLDIGMEYVDSILNYVVYRCWSKDSEYANASMATAYYQAYMASMGAGDTGEQSTTPTNKVPA